MSLPPVTIRRERIAEFDYLRGMAIAMIVLGHSIFLAQPVFPALLENVLRGGTGLFVFISGFFFHHVFYPRFDYTQFIAKKASALLIPFLIISAFALLIRMFGWWQDGLNWQENLLNAWYTLRNGYILYPHWYIPFIFLTFLCSPLHLLYIRAHLSVQIIVFAAFSLIALLIHRPQSNSNFLQSLIYFTPYYLLGILFSQYEPQLRRWHWPLLVVSMLVIATTAIVQTYIWKHIGNYHKAAFVYEGWDLQFIQVLFGCIAMLALCRHIRPWLQQHLCWLADLSFPIFFIHPLVTIALENLVAMEAIEPFFPVSSLGTSLLVFIAVFLVQFYGSAGFAVLVRKIAKRNSRFIVG
ncbi:MAG: acyltransferase [Cellvibrio sp.]|uniref:acyltransferase n=1 Tax=Cellvibrio sp. TaxID=1965322 RepID=UPI00272054D1|nr:acyltransferase [Cellvibrio sp.]